MAQMHLFRWTGLWACFAIGAGHAQQLVPNPGFEEVTSCPTFASMLGHAAPWFNPTVGTPELYHACAGSGTYAGVPANMSGGYQQPRSGQGFAGIYTYRTDLADFREYIEVPLLAPLEAGRCYSFSMFVNMPNEFELACDAVGAYFSTGPITATNASVLPVAAAIEHPAGALITDTVGWTEVAGNYTAIGGEDHLVIGNFRTDAATNILLFHPGTWYLGQAYLLVDDVSLLPVENSLDLGPDAAICEGASHQLDATVPGMSGVLWNDGLATPVRTVTAAGTYSVEVSVGNCVLRDTVVVDVQSLPSIELGEDRELCEGMSIALLAITDPASTVHWDNGATGHLLEVAAPGVYRATSVNGCGSATDSVRITRGDCPEDIFLPNAFTPNGDGINDWYEPVYDRRLWRVEYRIYDRWGRLCQEATDGRPWDAAGWPQGIYQVSVQATALRKGVQDRVLLGHVALLR